MFKRFLKKIPFLGPFLLAALSFPLVTHAFFGTAVLVVIAIFVLLLLQWVGGAVFIFAGWFTSFALDLNYGILLGPSTFIKTGWTIVRDLTNLGFVLVIIVIAIATILRYKAYGAGQLLTKLIAAAIIVNFSLTIAGVFLDFSHSLTKFFFNSVAGFGRGSDAWGGQVGGVVDTLSAAFSPQRFFADSEIPEPIDEPISGFLQFGTEQLTKLTSLVFVVIFTFTAAFTLFALAILLFLRYVYLSFLLVLAPIVWLFWIIPSFKKYFSEWWSAFVKWTIFAPASAFFLYLSLVSIQAIAGDKAIVTTNVFLTNGLSGALSTILQHGVRLFVLTGFFFGSLIAAQKLGVAGASGTVGLAKKWQKGATKWAGQKVKRGAARVASAPLRSRIGRKAINKMQTLGKDKGFFWRGLAAPARVTGRVLAGATARADKRVAEEQELLKGKALIQQARAYNSLGAPGRVAVLQNITKQGKDIKEGLESASKRFERAANSIKAAKAQLAAAQAKPNNEEEIQKAMQTLLDTENKQDDAKKQYGAAKEASIQFERVLRELPNDVHNALTAANFNLLNSEIGSKRIPGVSTPLLQAEARRFIATIFEEGSPQIAQPGDPAYVPEVRRGYREEKKLGEEDSKK
ncbi:MAG: hypothetical protein Q8P01_05310 [bacterium]|nr:hypothetical protein [bacterium]